MPYRFRRVRRLPRPPIDGAGGERDPRRTLLVCGHVLARAAELWLGSPPPTVAGAGPNGRMLTEVFGRAGLAAMPDREIELRLHQAVPLLDELARQLGHAGFVAASHIVQAAADRAARLAGGREAFIFEDGGVQTPGFAGRSDAPPPRWLKGGRGK